MALRLATIEDIRTETTVISYPADRLTEVVVTSTPRDIYREAPGTQPLLIIRFDSDADGRRAGVTEHLGTVRMVGPSYSNHNGWLYYVNDDIVRVHGAPLNPEPVNGHHYRLLSANHAGYLLRYNDDDHRNDRGRGDLPWTILETGFGADAPMFGPDGFSNHTITNPYVEVNYTPQAAASPWANATEPEIATVGIPTTIPATDRRLHSLAVSVDGLVTLNPEPVLGQMYLLFPKNNGTDSTRIAMWTAGGFAIYGLLDSYHDFARDRGNNLTQPAAWDYVDLAMTEPRVIADQHRVVSLKRTLHDEKVQYHGWQEALNELAEEHDWCGEYESAVHRLGVMDRGLRRDDPVPAVPDIDDNGDPVGEPEPTTLRRLFMFDVSYDATFELESPSGRVDDAINYSTGITLSTSSMRFDGSGSVRVGPISAEGTDLEDMEREARDSIDSSMIEDAINADLSDADLNEVHNFNVDSDADDVTGEYDLEDYFDLD